jgi:TRAP-type C4-dicarboxylate transport system permease small subunit
MRAPARARPPARARAERLGPSQTLPDSSPRDIRTNRDHPVRRAIRRVSLIIRAVENTILIVLLVTIVAMIFAGVIARYVFSNPLQWSDELAIGLFVWLTFIGASAAWRDHTLFGIDMIVDRLPRRGRRVIWTFNLELPETVFEAALPVGSALMLWHTFEHMARVFRDELPIDDRYLSELVTEGAP